MNNTQTDMLRKHFDTALESPDGIKKLRELILTLAMQGKLVKQDPMDQPASELLKEIQAEKERLIAEGKIKKQKELAEIKLEEVPYAVPEGWVWTRLGNVCVKVSDGFHHSAKKISQGIKYISATHINNGWIDWNSGLYVSEKEYIELLKKTDLKEGDILIVNRGAGCGDAAIVDTKEKFCFQNAAIIGFPQNLIFGQYLLKYIHKSKGYFLEKFIQGGAQPMLSNKLLATHPFPLPPLAEQKRIVAKIDELMVLCDKLEEQRKNRNQKRLAVHTAAINRLLTADKNEFDTAWQFITRHFEPIYSVKENVAELKKAILTLAMQGKLVKQDPKDQPASELLKEIQAEKERLITEGKIKRGSRGGAEHAEIKPEEVPYEVPESWVWTRLGIASDISMGQSPDGKSYNEIGNGVPLVNGPVEFGGKSPFDLTVATKFTTSPTKMCDKGDLLLCVRGSTTGRTNIAGFDSCIGRGVASLKPYIFSQFLNQFILSLRDKWIEISTGSTFPNISQEKIQNYLIPLPPLAEQKRIVAKINELMALCDKLENQIEKATLKQTALFNAVLAAI